jgi:putative transposase
VDYVHYWADRSQVGKGRIVKWIGLGSSKFYNWQQRYGKATEHNARIPRDHWLEAWERKAIIRGFHAHPDDGYRRLTYLLMDANTVAVSPSTTYRVLKSAGLLQRWNTSNSRKGKGFQQPAQPHEHWHIDISHINICGTFYYLCSILDGASRYLVHWELRESMRESDVEVVLQRAREKFPAATPRIISDNGPQGVAGTRMLSAAVIPPDRHTLLCCTSEYRQPQLEEIDLDIGRTLQVVVRNIACLRQMVVSPCGRF